MPASKKQNGFKSFSWSSAILAVAILAMGGFLPVFSAYAGLPSTRLIDQTIIAQCPVTETKECMATAELLQSLAGFYEVVIIVLIALLALIASLVYFSIRVASKRQVEEQFEKDFESAWFKDRLRNNAESAAEKLASDLARRIEVLENTLADKKLEDKSEEGNERRMIILPGEE